MSIVDVLGLIFAAVISVHFVLYLRQGRLKRDFAIFRVFRRGRWVGALFGSWVVLFVVLALGNLLIVASPQFFGWSWLRLLSAPGKPESGTNLVASGLTIPGFAWVFLMLMALNVPRLAMNEELAFRKGFKRCGEITYQSVKFGLVHCIVGVPLGFGLALGVAGGWFAFQYLRGATRRSAAYHSIHNWTLLFLAAIWIGSSGLNNG